MSPARASVDLPALCHGTCSPLPVPGPHCPHLDLAAASWGLSSQHALLTNITTSSCDAMTPPWDSTGLGPLGLAHEIQQAHKESTHSNCATQRKKSGPERLGNSPRVTQPGKQVWGGTGSRLSDSRALLPPPDPHHHSLLCQHDISHLQLHHVTLQLTSSSSPLLGWMTQTLAVIPKLGLHVPRLFTLTRLLLCPQCTRLSPHTLAFLHPPGSSNPSPPPPGRPP